VISNIEISSSVFGGQKGKGRLFDFTGGNQIVDV